jgi:hypothetical protein
MARGGFGECRCPPGRRLEKCTPGPICPPQLLTALRIRLTTGGDWLITPEGVPEASPLARVLRGREEWGGGRHPNTTGSLASRVDRPARGTLDDAFVGVVAFRPIW